jgi:hypothetical protein
MESSLQTQQLEEQVRGLGLEREGKGLISRLGLGSFMMLHRVSHKKGCG